MFAARVKCGHTYPNFYNQKKATQQALFRAGRVPFYFRWLGRRMIVSKSFVDDPRVQPGTEVLAINGTPVETILSRLMTVARADGNNTAKRVSGLEVQGTDRIEAFDVYFPLFFPSTSSEMTLRVRGVDERAIYELAVQPQTAEARLAAMTAAATARDGEAAPAWEFRLLDDGIGHLRMPTWALYDSQWDWKSFLTESMQTLVQRDVADLVIDLRGNEGGMDVGDELIAHLAAHEVPREALHRRVRYRKVPDDLVPYLDTWDPSFRNWGAAAVDSSNGFYRLRRDADDDPGSAIQPIAPRYAGRVWVLIGAANSSATFEFAQTLRRNQLGTLVGQPTGGNQRGINGGAFFFLRLPNSGIELDLPLIGQFSDGPRPDAGLEPDLLVTRSQHDIASGRDAELEAVRARVRRGRD